MSDGYTNIHWAAATCNIPRMQDILSRPGCDVNCMTSKGWTALHLAARSGFVEIIRMLLDDGRVDTHMTNEDGQTALRIASDCHHIEAANLLMTYGNPTPEDRQLALDSMAQEERIRRLNDAKFARSARDLGVSRIPRRPPSHGNPGPSSTTGHGAGLQLQSSHPQSASAQLREATLQSGRRIHRLMIGA